MLVFDPQQRATAEDLCKHPIIFQYLKDNGLFGPGLTKMLTSPRLIEVGTAAQPTLLAILSSKQKTIEKVRDNATALGSFLPLANELVPFMMLRELHKKNQNKNLYYEFALRSEAREVQGAIQATFKLGEFCRIQSL
jgi:hypothetical protein